MSWRLLVLGIPTADVRRSSPQLSAELASTATFKTLTLHLGCIMSNMSNHAQYPWTGQDRGMVSNGEKSRERRQWVRFILPNMLTRLSWANGTETVTHLVSLVDVSANGAAVTHGCQACHRPAMHDSFREWRHLDATDSCQSGRHGDDGLRENPGQVRVRLGAG